MRLLNAAPSSVRARRILASMSDPVQPKHSQWRPQRFGRYNGRKVHDPLIEPVWVGERVLAHIETVGSGAAEGRPFVAIQDETGELLDAYPEVAEAIGSATRANSLVIDGYLTDRVDRGAEGMALTAIPMPSSSDMTRQLLMGGDPEWTGRLWRVRSRAPAVPVPLRDSTQFPRDLSGRRTQPTGSQQWSDSDLPWPRARLSSRSR